MRPYVASQALGQERLYDIARTPGEKGKQLAEDSLDRYIECGEGQEILVTDAHLIRSSQFNTDLEVLSLEEIEHIDVGETGDKLVVRVAHAGVARHVLAAGGDPARARGRRRGEHALAGPEEGVGAGRERDVFGDAPHVGTEEHLADGEDGLAELLEERDMATLLRVAASRCPCG